MKRHHLLFWLSIFWMLGLSVALAVLLFALVTTAHAFRGVAPATCHLSQDFTGR